MVFLFTLMSAVFAADVQDGDIIFHTSRSAQSEAIALATDSALTHVGIITIEDGRALVVEAVQPVKVTPLTTWIARGVGGKYRLMRPKKPLNSRQVRAMRQEGRKHLGKHYDLRFEWSDDRMYCSELVWKIYQEGAGIELAKLRPMDSYRLGHPKVRALIAKRWGSGLDWKSPMVAPSDLAESTLLQVVSDTTQRR